MQEETNPKKINPLLRIYRSWKFRRDCAKYNPRHVVVEADKYVYIDHKRIHHVLVPDGVNVEPFDEYSIITLKFIAKSYRRE